MNGSWFLRVLSLSLVVAGGCTHVRLRNNTVKQSITVTDIFTQQVLDNLAMFVYDPRSLPSFAVPNQGTSAVEHGATGDVGLGFITSGFDSASLGVTGSYGTNQNWVLDPIRDSTRLALMRCAYQETVFHCLGNPHAGVLCSGDDCKSLKRRFYGDDDLNHAGNRLCLDGCWFYWGKKADVPRGCDCLLVGHYCGVYVWVLPEGREGLSRLTLAILDYAIGLPAPPPAVRTKDVLLFLNSSGELVTRDQAVKEIRAVIPVNQPASSLLSSERRARALEFLGRFPDAELHLRELLQSDEYRTQSWDQVTPKSVRPEVSGVVQALKELNLRPNDILNPPQQIPETIIMPLPPVTSPSAETDLLRIQERLRAASPRP